MAATSRLGQPLQFRRRARLPRARSRGAVGNPSMTALSWAFAFYGCFVFIPLGMAAAVWFGP